jgi:hypothetical protein
MPYRMSKKTIFYLRFFYFPLGFVFAVGLHIPCISPKAFGIFQAKKSFPKKFIIIATQLVLCHVLSEHIARRTAKNRENSRQKRQCPTQPARPYTNALTDDFRCPV